MQITHEISSNSLKFSEVTLITNRGLPYEKRRDPRVWKMLPFNGRYCHCYRSVVPLRLSLNLVTGTMCEINR